MTHKTPATVTRQVPLVIDEGRNRGTEAQLRRLQGNYLIRSGKWTDGHEYRLFLNLSTKALTLWTEGKPDRHVSLDHLIQALTSEGREP